jgi:gluconokinase
MLVTRTRSWDADLMNVLGVKPEQFPPLGDLHESLQGLTGEYVSRWPTLHNIPWFPAIGDGAAANVGSGCASEHNWALTIGTSSAIRVVVSPERVVLPAGLWLYYIDARRALLGGALSEGGNVFAWMANTLQLPTLKEAEPLVAALSPDGHGLTILPFISGERSSGWHAEARVVIDGLQTHTSPADILRASMEAVAYQLQAVYQQLIGALHETKPRLIGSGGALLSSSTLQHIVADALGSPLYPLLEHEASARGAALLALEAMGVIQDIGQETPSLAEAVQPDAERGRVYQQAADRQMQLYRVLLGDVSE